MYRKTAATVALLLFCTAADFHDIGPTAGLLSAGVERGLAWGDFDGDGDDDVFVAVLRGSDRLFRNDGGVFEDVAPHVGLDAVRDTGAAAWADFDADGRLDLFLACAGSDVVFLQQSDGSFVEAGLPADTLLGWGVAPADYDGDGDLDVFVVNFSGNDRLWRNDGTGRFEDVAPSTGVDDPGQGTSAAWADIDRDGDLDLHVAVKRGPNRLYLNDGEGRFESGGPALGLDDAGDATGVAWGDVDGDGDLDLFLARDRAPDRLFRNAGDAGFEDVASSWGVDHPGSSRACGFADFDHDGDLDLFVVASDGPNRLYRNDGGFFVEIGAAAGLADPGTGTAAGWIDVDHDGDLDLLLTGMLDPIRLFENRLRGDHHWIGVRFRATAAVLGAELEIHRRDAVLRRALVGGGYQTQGPRTVHCGLGADAVVDSVVVRWPDGVRQRVVIEAVDRWVDVARPDVD